MINIFKALVEKMDKTHQQLENFSRKIETIRNSQWKCHRERKEEKCLNGLTNKFNIDEESVKLKSFNRNYSNLNTQKKGLK